MGQSVLLCRRGRTTNASTKEVRGRRTEGRKEGGDRVSRQREKEREREEHAISPLPILSFIYLLTSGLPARPTARLLSLSLSLDPPLPPLPERKKEKKKKVPRVEPTA